MSRRRSIMGYEDARGVWHDLRDPDGPATGKQLLWLCHNGMLDLVPHRHQVEPITSGEAASAIADVMARDPLEPAATAARRRPRRRRRRASDDEAKA